MGSERVLHGIPGECGCGAGRRLGGAERTTATQSESSRTACVGTEHARSCRAEGRSPQDLRRGRAPYARAAKLGRRTAGARRKRARRGSEGRKERGACRTGAGFSADSRWQRPLVLQGVRCGARRSTRLPGETERTRAFAGSECGRRQGPVWCA